MPLSSDGKKIKRNFRKEYGQKEGDKILYSKENKDKKFKKLLTHGSKKAIWWAERISKLPESKKSVMMIILVDDGIEWWTRRFETLRASRPRPVDKMVGQQPNIPKDE
jgi:hypothetical protein